MSDQTNSRNEMSVRINVGRDFSKFPGGRLAKSAKRSGEQFREDLLIPALSKGSVVTVFLDDAISYGSSFLDEAFAGLVRKGVLNRNDFYKRIIIETRNPLWKKEIEFFVESTS